MAIIHFLNTRIEPLRNSADTRMEKKGREREREREREICTKYIIAESLVKMSRYTSPMENRSVGEVMCNNHEYPQLPFLINFFICGITSTLIQIYKYPVREECRLRVFENRILNRIFGPKRDENGEWRMRNFVVCTVQSD